MFELHHVRVMVAGGSSGIGLATAKLLIDYDGGLRLVGQKL